MWSLLPEIAQQIARERHASAYDHASHGRPLHGSRRSSLRPRQRAG
jgi:hypothetical protein